MEAFRNAIIVKFQRCIWLVIWAQFSRENNFISLFVRIWIKLHFTLINPITYLFKVSIKFTYWFIYVINPWKNGCIIYKYFTQMNLFHHKDNLCILKIKALPLILVELQTLFFSTRMFDHLKQLFDFDFYDSLWVTKVVHLQHHKLLT